MKRYNLWPAVTAFLILLAVGVLPLSCTTLPSPTSAPKSPTLSNDLDSPLPLDPGFRQGNLSNGLRYFIRPNREPANRAVLMLVVNAGSILEDDDQLGLAHFVEHMAFKGTQHFPGNKLVEYLESIGMASGTDVNAMTDFDSTTFIMQIPTDRPEVFDQALLILEDWAGALTFPAEAIEKERGVVLEEWRLGRGAEARMQDQYMPVLLHESRYAARLPIGEKKILENFSRETLSRFYHDWYRPDLMAVIAVGDFAPAQMEGLIKNHFSNLVNPAEPRPRISYPVPDHKAPLFSAVTDPEASQTNVSLFFKHDKKPEKSVRDYREQMVLRLFNDMLNSRFYELLQEGEPPFLSAAAFETSIARTKDAYILDLAVEDNGIGTGMEAMWRETERARRQGFTQPELERQKKELLNSMEMMYQEQDKTASGSFAAEFSRHFLEGEPIPGLENEYLLYKKLIPGITLEEVNRLADTLMPETNLVTIITAPEKAKSLLPDAAALAAITTRVRGEDITPYQENGLDLPLMPQIPEPGQIVSEKRIEPLGVNDWRLANGIRILLKPTTFMNNQILFTAFSPGGTSLVPDREYIAATTAASVVPLGGLGSFSQLDLAKKLAGKTVSVSPYIQELSEGLSGSASIPDMETMFQLINLSFTAPRADQQAYLSLLARMRGSLANRDSEPETLFADTVNATLSQNHFRTRPMTLELMKEMDLKTSMEIYRDRFADAGDFTFIFVGSFTPEEIKPLICRYLGSLPATGRQESFRDVGIDPPAGVIKKVIRQGLEPKSMATVIFSGPFTWEQQLRFDLLAMVDLLNIRLRESLREDLGGTYSVWASVDAAKFPHPEYTLAISMGSSPERQEELIAEIFAQIKSLRNNLPTREEVKKIQELQRRERETNLRSNGYWLKLLDHYAENGDDLLNILNFDTLVNTLNPEAISRAARRFLDPENYVQVVLLPEQN